MSKGEKTAYNGASGTAKEVVGVFGTMQLSLLEGPGLALCDDLHVLRIHDGHLLHLLLREQVLALQRDAAFESTVEL